MKISVGNWSMITISFYSALFLISSQATDSHHLQDPNQEIDMQRRRSVVCSFLSFYVTMSLTGHRFFQPVSASANNARYWVRWDDTRKTWPSHRSRCFDIVIPVKLSSLNQKTWCFLWMSAIILQWWSNTGAKHPRIRETKLRKHWVEPLSPKRCKPGFLQPDSSLRLQRCLCLA